MEMQNVPPKAGSPARGGNGSSSEDSTAPSPTSSGAETAVASSSSSRNAAVLQGAATAQNAAPKAPNIAKTGATPTQVRDVSSPTEPTLATANAGTPEEPATTPARPHGLDFGEAEYFRLSRRIVDIEGTSVVGLPESDEEFYLAFTEEQRVKVRRKIDWRLIPVLCLLYLFAQLDRSNIANAKIEGLKEDTKMTDKQYNFVLAIFFIPYFMLEVPSNMILRGLRRPSRYIGFLVISWGIIMTCHGFATDYDGFVVLRFMLGVFESGFFPAATYLCSHWYRPHELAFRLSLFMAVAASSGAFSGLLAAAIGNMSIIYGNMAWRWIFWIEGSVTIFLGVLTPFMLVDTPEWSQKWLDADNIRYMRISSFIKNGGMKVGHEGTLLKIITLRDLCIEWRTWAFAILFHNIGACGYGLKFAVPTIIRGMGYSKTKSQTLSAVPYVFGVISSLVVSFVSDKMSLRSPFIIGGLASIALGFTMILFVVNFVENVENMAPGVIIGMSFVTSGVFPMAPIGGSWLSNNLGSSSRRAIGLAFAMGVGSLGGLTGSYMYRESDSPHFSLAYAVSLGLSLSAMGIVGLLVWSYRRDNKKREAIPVEEINAKYTAMQLIGMADKSPLFRFKI